MGDADMEAIPFPVIRPSSSAYLQTDRPHIALQARGDPNAPDCAQVYLLVYKTQQGRWAMRSEFIKVPSQSLLGLEPTTAKTSIKARLENAIAGHGAKAPTRKLAEVIFYRGITLLAIESVGVKPRHVYRNQES